MSEERKWMSIEEFQSEGYLQEANRQFFHPLGLALAAGFDPQNERFYLELWDYRDDPEGMFFSVEELDNEEARRKAANVEGQRLALAAERIRVSGSGVQMLGAPFLDDLPPVEGDN